MEENKKLKIPIGAFLLWATVLIDFVFSFGYWTIFPHLFSHSPILLYLFIIFFGVCRLMKNYHALLICASGMGVYMFLGIIIVNIYRLADHVNLYVDFRSLTMFAACIDIIILIMALYQNKFPKNAALGKKLKFLPLILLGILFLYIIIHSIRVEDSFLYPPYIIYILFFMALFFVADEIVEPEKYKELFRLSEKPKTVPQSSGSAVETTETIAEEVAEIYCEMPKHILLCLFTFGIWYLIWIYRSTRYLNRAPGGEQYDPTKKLLLCMFVPFYQIYWFYKHGQKLDSFMKARNIGGSEMTTLCLILGIFVPIVACILMQDKYNQLCTVDASNRKEETPTKTESDTIDNLERYKDLLDKGVITQEEFDAKKKQLLNL